MKTMPIKEAVIMCEFLRDSSDHQNTSTHIYNIYNQIDLPEPIIIN